MIRLLVVEDSVLMRKLLGRIFEAEADFVVDFARDGAEALAMIHRFRPDVVTLDVQMPRMDGLECLDRIMVEFPCPVVMVSSLTAEGAEETLTALATGAVDFIPKPAGAISLGIDELAPRLIEKVRMAASARIKRSHRLSERIRAAAKTKILSDRPTPSTQSLSSRTELVLVGCSTGGPPALDCLLGPLSKDFPAPIVVAQHMPQSFTGALARRLDQICDLEVRELARQEKLEAGTVYIARGDADVVISRRAGSLMAMPAPSDDSYRWHPSVDRMVQSAMRHVSASALVGVLMTGMGNDGATAMTRLRAAGGHTIAEAEATAVVWGMPGALVKMDGASTIRRVEDIAATLMEHVAS